LGARIEAGFLNAREVYVAVLTLKKIVELKIGFSLRRPPNEEGPAMIKEEAAAAAAEFLNKKKRKAKAARIKVETRKEHHDVVAQCVTGSMYEAVCRSRV
jgi:hypothetical protein